MLTVSTTLSSREFNQDTGRAKRAAARGPVFITDRGKPAHVLLNIAEYQRLAGGLQRNILDSIALPGLSEIDLETVPARDLARPADLD